MEKYILILSINYSAFMIVKNQKIVVCSISEIHTVTLAKMEINSIDLEKCIEIYMVLFLVMVPFYIKQAILQSPS